MHRARGYWLSVTKHAVEGMRGERPEITSHDLLWMFEEPDHDDGNAIRKTIGKRTIHAYYEIDAEEIRVRAVSATRTRRQ